MSFRNHHARRIAVVLMAFMALSCAPIAGASPPNTLKSSLRPILSARDFPISYDLDGDHRADRVSLLSNGFAKTIRIAFANFRSSDLNFTAMSAERGSLVASDIDHDGDLDLIWVGSSEQKTAVVWINDGEGNFAAAKDNTSYASEINALLSSSNPSDQRSLQAGRQAYSLMSSSSPDIGLTVTSRLASPRDSFPSTSGFNEGVSGSVFLSDLRKRGPPIILS